MEVNPQFSNYDETIEKKPDQWSYVKLGLSTDHERIMEQMHVDFVMNTGRILNTKPKPVNVKHTTSKNNNMIRNIKYYSEY